AAARTDREALIAELTAALEAYEVALASEETIRAAQRLANDVWHALPHYLAWNAAAANRTEGPTREHLKQLLAELAALDKLLAAPAAGKAADVRAAVAALAQSRRAIEHDLDLVNVEQLLAAPASPGEG